jgi:hypothetical protein
MIKDLPVTYFFLSGLSQIEKRNQMQALASDLSENGKDLRIEVSVRSKTRYMMRKLEGWWSGDEGKTFVHAKTKRDFVCTRSKGRAEWSPVRQAKFKTLLCFCLTVTLNLLTLNVFINALYR